ncbi:MAG: RNA polymerase sigma-54 factor [Spirochaetaceae bacterium]|nr:MAG: RNA polymerase sigma-54 factor [Spirochaetaceae bacterium]
MQFQKPVLVQRQELRMTPQLLQSIQIMTLPLQELQFRIQEELEANPALDVVEETPTVSLNDRDEMGEEYDYFENSSDPGYVTGSRFEGDEDSKRGFMEGALARPESLQEHLLWQLRLQPITEEEFDLGELVIRNLDENGFHRDDPETVFPAGKMETVRRMIAMIRTFEPVGTAVRDFRESLIVQAEQLVDPPPGVLEILRDHLELLERGRKKEIARALQITEEEVEIARETIRFLNPFPGRVYSTDDPGYVIPDLTLKRKEGQFVLLLNDEEIPVLGVNPVFAEVADGTSDRDARRFAGRGVKEARWFIHSIRQRNETLLKVARAILEFQRDFFIKGKKYLVPLTLKDIAQAVEVSEATVSRISNGKYIQTEWGIFELKHFFSNSVAGAGSEGSRFSKEGVKEIVREILEEQDRGDKQLSDQKVADLLAQRGIKIARRTVAKYRNELKISSSYER